MREFNPEYPEEIKELPVFPHLDSICTRLKESKNRCLVLKAQTAAGKSTALPFALLNSFSGKCIMLEPRRIAAINICQRVSDLLREPMGKTCGYKVHLESRGTDETRLNVVTDGVFVKMIQSDPSLEGINVVVFDEFHERTVNTDLALAFLKETLLLRDDLYVLIMSATIDTDSICRYMGAEVYEILGRLYPVCVEYKGNLTPSKAIISELKDTDLKYKGSILVFLPGIYEINKVKRELEEMGTDEISEICILHSSVPLEKIKEVVLGKKELNKKRKVILSSSIAESSLTVPDVDVVIDCGYLRTSEYDKRYFMNRLITRRVNLFSAEQRKGRAGRIREGKCVRLWSESELLPGKPEPEILRTNLSNVLLECFEWGVNNADSLEWLDNPSENAWNTALNELELVGCIAEGKITQLGKAVLQIGYDVRISCVALSGIPGKDIKLSTGIAANLIAGDSENSRNVEIIKKDLEFRVQKIQSYPQNFNKIHWEFTKLSTGCALLCGYPDRLAVKVLNREDEYQFYSGRTAVIQDCKHKYIIATDVDAGDNQIKVRSYEPLEESVAEQFVNKRINSVVEIKEKVEGKINSGVIAAKFYKYGNAILKKEKTNVSFEDYINFIGEKVKHNGLNYLPLSENSQKLLLRCRLLQEIDKTNECSVKFASLEAKTNEWLEPFLSGSTQTLNETTVYNALYWYLDGKQLDSIVPEKISLPNGKKRTLVYEETAQGIQPVLEIIIQQIFGCFSMPEICGKKILLKLLSPARRPLQVTTDLESFWHNTWPEICIEMKGRYPKHNWNYKIVSED